VSCFGESLKEADTARIELQREKISLDREKHAALVIEKEKDREERVAEREKSRNERSEERREQFELDILKFREMMGLVKCSKEGSSSHQ